jgi:hypothetical protein
MIEYRESRPGVYFRLDESLLNGCIDLAKEQKITRNQVFRDAIKSHLDLMRLTKRLRDK